MTAGKKWTDWPLDPTYLLAVRSAALAIARGQESGGSIAAGEVIHVPLDATRSALDPKMTTPGKNPADKNAAEPVEIEKPSPTSTLLRYAKTYHTGIYTLSWRDEKSNPRSARFAVNPPQSESDLDPLPESELAELLGNLKPIVQRYDTGGAASRTAPREICARWRRCCSACWVWKRCSRSGWEGNDDSCCRHAPRAVRRAATSLGTATAHGVCLLH